MARSHLLRISPQSSLQYLRSVAVRHKYRCDQGSGNHMWRARSRRTSICNLQQPRHTSRARSFLELTAGFLYPTRVLHSNIDLVVTTRAKLSLHNFAILRNAGELCSSSAGGTLGADASAREGQLAVVKMLRNVLSLTIANSISGRFSLCPVENCGRAPTSGQNPVLCI